jgi:hypothetical protein
MHHIRVRLAAIAVCVATLAYAQSQPQSAKDFLRKYLAFSNTDIAALDKGELVTKLPKVSDQREVAAFAVVRVNARPEQLAQQFHDIVRWKKSDSVPEIGKFSDTPMMTDLAGLTIEQDDIKVLKKCKPGACGVKLSETSMEQLVKETNWSAENYQGQAENLFKKMMIDYVGMYLTGGNRYLVNYADQKQVLKLPDDFSALLKESNYATEYAPEFANYIDKFPNAQLPDSENFIYWSKEKFGIQPVTSVTHVTIYPRKRGNSSEVLIASKQLYATHYFESSLAFTMMLPLESGDGSYLLYLNRSRSDTLRGFFSGITRLFISSHVRDGAAKGLQQAKERLEAGQAAK